MTRADAFGSTRRMERPRAVPPLRAVRPCDSGGEVLVTFPKALLRRWNVAMCLFHGILAAVTLSLANPSLEVPLYRTSLSFQVLRNGTFVDVDGVTQRGDSEVFRIWPYVEEHGALRLVDLTVAFFLLSATAHLLNATLLWRWYAQMLERCYTPTRWVEYTLSAPIMFVLISYGLGVRTRGDYVAGVALVATTMFFGFWTEREGRPASRDEWTRPLPQRVYPWLLGHVPQAAAWLVVLLQFYDNGWDSGRVPGFVHAILWGELLLFWSFGLASLASQCGPPRHFYRGELGFQVLSLVSKGLLGILLLSNVLMLQRFDEIYEREVG